MAHVISPAPMHTTHPPPCSFRADKDTANHVSVYEKVCASITDNVTEAELVAACPEMKRRWKERIAAAEAIAAGRVP